MRDGLRHAVLVTIWWMAFNPQGEAMPHSKIKRHFSSPSWWGLAAGLIVWLLVHLNYGPLKSRATLPPCDFEAVRERYQDPGMARYVRDHDVLKAQQHLNETMAIIEKHYYRPISYKTLLDKALRQLQMVVNTPVIAQQYQLTLSQLAPLKTLLEAQEQQLQHHADHLTPEQISAWISPMMSVSEQTGLGGAWPALELSYALADSLDDYSYIMTPDQYQSLQDRLNGFYVGIGVDLLFEGAYPTVFDVIDDSPAARAGIQPGDLLIAVQQHSCHQETGGAVSALLTGKPRSSVELTLRRSTQDLTVSATRDMIVAPSVRYARLVGPPPQPIGYLRIAGFDHDTAMEMRRHIDALVHQGATGLLIDLRSNGGGVMTSAIDAARLFLKEGTLVTVCHHQDRTRYCAGGSSDVYTLPLVLLVDNNTASAAEIFAAALKDNHRAVLIGRPTFGKALVQTIYNLPSSSTALCLTTACYMPPSSIDLNQIGLQPDIAITPPANPKASVNSMAELLSPEDPAVDQAIQFIHRHSAS